MQSAYCSRFQKIKNLYKKLVFQTTTLRKSILMCFCISPEDVNRCNLLIAVASKKSRICKEINFNVFCYFPRRTSIGAICLLQSPPKNQEFVQKKSFSNYYFEEINVNVIVFFYFPRTSSIGAICLLQSRPKNLLLQFPIWARVMFYQKTAEMNTSK